MKKKKCNSILNVCFILVMICTFTVLETVVKYLYKNP